MRDYCAAQAMQPLVLAAMQVAGPESNVDFAAISSAAYRMADAMLKAREGSMNIERIRAALDQPFGPLKCAESELRELLAENDRLRAAVQHEADCVEAAKAEVEALRAERDALLDALQHMRHCGWCAADDWQNCEGGRAALAAIDAAKERA